MIPAIIASAQVVLACAMGHFVLYNAGMLKRIQLENFKLHASTSIEAAPITVLIGPNNSGKSSILQALLALRQAAMRDGGRLPQSLERQPTSLAQPYLFSEQQMVDLGDFQDIVRSGQSEIRIGVSGDILKTLPRGQVLATELSFALVIREEGLVSHSGELKLENAKLAWTHPPHSSTFPSLQMRDFVLGFRTETGFRLLSHSAPTMPPNASPEKRQEASDLGDHLGNICLHFLNTFHPVYPLRGLEEWGLPLTGQRQGNLERMLLTDRTLALHNLLAYGDQLREQVSDWLEELLDIGLKIRILPPTRVAIVRKSRTKAKEGLFTNEGMGASQLLFILVPIGLSNEGETVLLSEPEAHLHPKAQSQLSTLLVRIATQQKRQFIIETHSEHVLHSLLHAVATRALNVADLAIFYFENKNGTAEIKRLIVDQKGRVEGGLPGFFEHSLTELSETLEALKKN